MNESNIIALIRRIIRMELAPILMGQITSNESESRSSVKRFPNEDPSTNLRTVMPFGFASKAPPGTQAFIVPAGNDQTNLNVLGHFDPTGRPPLADGDVALYDAHGHALYMSSGKIQFGSEASSENMVLGQVFKTMMSQLLEELSIHTHIGNLGFATAAPIDASVFSQLKASPVDDETILSDVAFTEKG